MANLIKLTFNENPEINDFIRLNENVIETFVASRTSAGEVTIGATIEDTITNLQNALTVDFGDLNVLFDESENILVINYLSSNEDELDLEINSDAITFEIDYFTYYYSEYTNSANDSFRVAIKGKDPLVSIQEFVATGTLSYKDVDNILAPVRGAQLDVNIDANINALFEEFLDFNEQDYKAELIRNDVLLFDGFVSPEGVEQSYNSINFQITITATDNLAALQNTAFPYNDELPSEFVLLDKCLKVSGLDLPIAFFDDINKNVSLSGITQTYGGTLDDPINNRIVDQTVFRNENGRYVSCDKVLKDILTKYNAVLKQESISYLDEEDNTVKSRLCWLFYRPALLQNSFLTNIRPYNIKQITNYSNQKELVEALDKEYFIPEVEQIGKFSSPTKVIGTDGQNGLDAIHKNLNQRIRQSRALQNFRFQQDWILKKSQVEYDFGNYTALYQASWLPNNVNDKLNFPAWSFLSNNDVDPTLPFTPPNNYTLFLLKHININVPQTNRRLTIKGSATTTGSNNNILYQGMFFSIVHVDVVGVRRFLIQPASFNGVFTINQLFLESASRFNDAEWIRDSDITPDALNDLNIKLFNTLFTIPSETGVNIDFEINLPPTVNQGGHFEFYLSPFLLRSSLLDEVTPQTLVGWSAFLNDINFIAEPPQGLGEGEYHDAINTQPISTKLDNPVSVINADETTNFFKNGLRRIEDNELQNYPYWTSRSFTLPNYQNLLELTSIERIRLFNKSQNIFSGDIHGYIPYFARLQNTAFDGLYFAFTKWIYDTADNTIQSEMRELGLGNPSVLYEKSYIFEEEENRLIE